jgi:hypothetical protein
MSATLAITIVWQPNVLDNLVRIMTGETLSSSLEWLSGPDVASPLQPPPHALLTAIAIEYLSLSCNLDSK